MYLRKNVILAILGGELLCFMLTTHMTWTSSVLPKLTNAATSPFGRAITKEEASWITSILTFGTIVGTYIFSYLSDKIGKKLTLLLAGVPCLISNVIIYYSTSVNLYILARFIVGLSVGTVFLFPVYVAELTHKNMREVIVTLGTCASWSGMIFSNSVGPFVSISTFSLILAAISLIFLIFFGLFGQEVPHYYIINNQDFLARAALEKLRGGYEDIDEAFDQIRNKYEEEKSGKLMEIFTSKPLIKGFIICTSLLAFQQFSGIIAIMYYGQNLVQEIDPSLSPEICVILLSIVIFLSSLFAPPLTSRFPKRTLLMFSGIGMFLSELVLGIYLYYQHTVGLPKSMASLPMICLTLFITFHNIGLGPLPYIILGEIFPTRIKGIATATVSLVLGIVSFLLSKYFIYMIDLMGIHGYFVFCAVCCLMATIFTKFNVIETKDKSLEEIQHELSL